jgi:hypothetical protein
MTTAERYNHEPGGFHATVDAFEFPGEPELSILTRRICRERHVWPSLLTNGCRRGYVVFARRLIWRGAYELTDLSIENIAQLFGYSAGTVRPWATSWRRFEDDSPVWWEFWGPSCADSVGVPLQERDE